MADNKSRIEYRISLIVMMGIVMAGCAAIQGITPTPTASPSPQPGMTLIPYRSPIPPSPEPTLLPEFQALKDTASGWEVDTIEPDGTGLRRISPPGVAARYPKFSPDGRWIAFARVDASPALMLYDRRSGETQVVRLPANFDSAPVWSSDSSRLLLTPGADFVVYDLKTGKLSAPIRWDDIQAVDSASLSPNGKQIAFTGSTTPRSTNSWGTWEIYTVQTNGAGRHQLTHSGGQVFIGAWSPVSDMLAYVEAKDIKVIWPDTPSRPAKVLGRADIGADHIMWSRNGQFIAVSDFLKTQIFNIKTGAIHKAFVLTMGTEVATSWSPDLSKMLFEIACCTAHAIVYTDLASVGADHRIIDYHILGDHPFYEGDPDWAPDADLIAFTGNWNPPGP